MRQIAMRITVALLILCANVLGQEHQAVATNTDVVVPPLVNFTGVLTNVNGQPLTGVVGVTFLLYKDEQGGAPLWLETQNVRPDRTGHYSVSLGATSSAGLPTDIFSSGDAHWLGVQAEGQTEQPRVLLVAVPYALKAADAQTVGGLPPSAFVLAAPPNGSAPPSASPATAAWPSSAPASSTITGTGTVNFLPLWDTSSDIVNSVIFQSGSGSPARIGINTTSPGATLDVKGGTFVRGALQLPSTGTASATLGFNSQPFNLQASSFNSATGKPVSQNFQWQAEPAGNNTSSPSGTLNLLFGAGTKPVETGLSIASNGQITFATGQTFPGNGTITGVTAGTDLTGGGTSGSVTLNLDTTRIPELAGANTFTANQTVNGSVIATAFSGNGAAVTNVNASQLGGLSSGSFAQLSAANTFTNKQTVNNTTVMTGTDTSGVLQITNAATSGPAPAIVGTTSSSAAAGIKGIVAATTGTESGVLGRTSSATGNGVSGIGGTGVLGTGTMGSQVGVYGISSAASLEGASTTAPRGVWGDTNGEFSVGVFGTADDGNAGAFLNNTSLTTHATLYAENDSSSSTALVFDTLGTLLKGSCTIDVLGNLACSGTKSAVVPVDSGSRQVALYAVEAPENWFEDAGSGQLENGSARIELDPTFAQTVNTTVDYHVFLTPNGDCKGLYVSQKSATSFEVHELNGGTSSVAFDYRIMAKRHGFENLRLADLTERYKNRELQHARLHQLRRQQQPARP